MEWEDAVKNERKISGECPLAQAAGARVSYDSQGKEQWVRKMGRIHRPSRYEVGVSQALEWSIRGPRLVRLRCALEISSQYEALGHMSELGWNQG